MGPASLLGLDVAVASPFLQAKRAASVAQDVHTDVVHSDHTANPSEMNRGSVKLGL